MNTKMLMLGILLIAGLSFAATTWMEPVYYRYGCACDYVQDEYGLEYIAGNWGFYTPEMNEYAQNMCTMGGDLYGMWVALYDGDEPDVAMFRANMAAFNSHNALFKREFNTQLRIYLAESEDPEKYRAGILEDLQYAREDIYTDCVRNPRK
jgi:hypothetical protein